MSFLADWFCGRAKTVDGLLWCAVSGCILATIGPMLLSVADDVHALECWQGMRDVPCFPVSLPMGTLTDSEDESNGVNEKDGDSGG